MPWKRLFTIPGCFLFFGVIFTITNLGFVFLRILDDAESDRNFACLPVDNEL